MTEAVKNGDTIKVEYTGKFTDGEVFDTSSGRTPLKFTVGTGQLIKGFDDAVTGMAVGDKKTVTIAPEDGYGLRNEENVIDLPKSTMPEGMEVAVGMQLQLSDPQGRPVPATVAEITDDTIKMDVNHFLAGKTLVFDIEVVETGLEPDVQGCGGSCGCSSAGDCSNDDGCGSGSEGGCGC